MKKALVTGATGFIGQWVVNELLSQGVFVYAIVRSEDKAKRVFADKNNLVILTWELINNLMSEEIDVCYHFAWQGVSGDDLRNWEVQLQNIQRTMELIQKLKNIQVKKFIGAGSLHELEYLKELENGSPLKNGGLMYKGSKLLAHNMAEVFLANEKMQMIWPIITNTFGVGEKSARLINSTILKILNGESPEFTSGEQNYDFIYISDVAKAFYLIGEYGKADRKYVIGSGNVKPLKEYLQTLGRLVDSEVRLSFGTVDFQGINLPKECYNISQLVDDTGFKPQISFEDGILLVKEWMRMADKY